MKKAMALMLSLVMALSLGACTTGGTTESAASGGSAAATGAEIASGEKKDTVVYAYPE